MLNDFGACTKYSYIEKLKKKIVRKEKRYSRKRAPSPLIEDTNFDLENNDSRKALIRCGLIFFHKLYITLLHMICVTLSTCLVFV